MTPETLEKVQQVALSIGHPWHFNHLNESCCWHCQIIDGTGRGLYISAEKTMFRIEVKGRLIYRTTEAIITGEKCYFTSTAIIIQSIKDARLKKQLKEFQKNTQLQKALKGRRYAPAVH